MRIHFWHMYLSLLRSYEKCHHIEIFYEQSHERGHLSRATLL